MVSSGVDDEMREAAAEFKKVTGGITRATDVKGAVRRAGQTIRDETRDPAEAAHYACRRRRGRGGRSARGPARGGRGRRPAAAGRRCGADAQQASDADPETPSRPMRTLPKWRRKTPEEREGAMSLIDHLKELRHRLVICIWALLAGSVVGFFLYEPVMRLIQSPYCDFLRENPDKAPVRAAGVLAHLPRCGRRVLDHGEGGRVPGAPGRAAGDPVPALGVHRPRPHGARAEVGDPVRGALHRLVPPRRPGRLPDAPARPWTSS